MASLPPKMQPAEIVAMAESFAENPEQIAAASALVSQMPGADSFYAALIMVFQDTTMGECKDCACTACVTMRETLKTMAGQFGD